MISVVEPCLVLLLALPAFQDEKKFEEWVVRLGADDPDKREAAEVALEKMGESILGKLEEVRKKHDNAEIRQRAGKVVNRIWADIGLRNLKDAWYRLEDPKKEKRGYCRLQTEEATYEGKPCWKMTDTVVIRRKESEVEDEGLATFQAFTEQDEKLSVLHARYTSHQNGPKYKFDIEVEASIKDGKVVLKTPRWEVKEAPEAERKSQDLRKMKEFFNREITFEGSLIWYH